MLKHMSAVVVAEEKAGAGAAVPLAEHYARAVLIRQVEQTLLDLFARGELFGTVHTCIGQEWTGVAVAACLRRGDVVLSNHRCHGHYLALTDDVEGLIAEIMGRQTGVCGGRGGSQHLCAEGFFSNGVQGGMTPAAAGLALALKRLNGDQIVVAFIGDGTLGEGTVYESLNIVSKWQLPVLILLENNLYAQSTFHEQTLAGDILARPAAFGIPTFEANTWQPEELLAQTLQAIGQVRRTRGPCFLRVDTYRLMAHSKGDDNRDPQEVKRHWERDPVTVFLGAHGEEGAKMQQAAQRRVAAAVEEARKAPFAAPLPESPGSAALRLPQWHRAELPVGERVVTCIHDALRRNLRRDERIVLIGEDIEGPYGGAFKVTRDLSAEFPGRVFNTPISEAAIVGLGNGLALAGLRPVCELMFGDFLTLAADQFINHAAKFRYMYNDRVRVPLIIRTPMGGKRGYGATHSQSLEKHFLGLPDTQVLAIHHRFDPGEFYDRLFATVDRPTLVIENKLLYAARVGGAISDGFALEYTDDSLPTTRLRPEGTSSDLTIVCYGGMLPDVEKAVDALFEEHEIACEVICPMRLYPLDVGPILESVLKSRRLLLVEEGLGFAAFGAEVAAQILEHAPGVVEVMARIASPEHPIPSCGPLEKELLPGEKHIIQRAREMVLAGRPQMDTDEHG
jgi:2-oxoisovalerate dehydrogenase E1 component